MRSPVQSSVAQFFILSVILFAGVICVQAATPPAIALSSAASPRYIGKELQYLPLGRQIPTITELLQPGSDIQWRSREQSTLFLGNRIQNAWVRFALKASGQTTDDWVLEITWPYFDVLEMYVVYKSQAGTDKIAMHLPLKNHLPFAFALPPHENAEMEIYLKLHNTGKLLLPLRIVPEDVFMKDTLIRHILLGILFGTLLVMCLYNTSLSIFTHDDSYSYYVLYVFSIILYTLDNTGVGQTYFWPESSYIKAHSYGVFSTFSFFTATLFIRRFLRLKKHGGWLLHLSNTVIAFWLVMLGLYCFSNHHIIIGLEDYGAFITCIAGLVTTITLWKKGNVSAKYLTIAWTLLILSTVLLMLGLTGNLPFTPLVQNSQNAGFIIEVILLSLALAERINRTRKAEEAAQRKILAMERQANILLEKRVAQRTIDLRRAMDTLEIANRELGTLNLQDELTRISNRRHFNLVYEREYKRAIRHKLPLSLILADLDHFKQVNDSYGHQAGDLCLQHTAKILRSQAARAEDFVARYGGEEFIIILPGMDGKAAEQTAERMRRKIETTQLRIHSEKLRITASFGVAELAMESDTTFQDFLARADKALYHAKSKGRNRTEVSS